MVNGSGRKEGADPVPHGGVTAVALIQGYVECRRPNTPAVDRDLGAWQMLDHRTATA